MARKISISFKETTKDLELYNLIMTMDDKSYELKQIIRKALQAEVKSCKEVKKKEEETEVNILDF